MNADLSHDPAKIPAIISLLKKHDVVIDSRYIKGGRIIGFSMWRLLLSNTAQGLCRYLLGIKSHDSTNAFRGYRIKILKSIKLETIKSEGYFF